MENVNNDTLVSLVKDQPFKTAFKVYMGVAAAQLVTLGIAIGGFATVCLIGAWVLG